MKLLAVFFVLGLAIAAAVPISYDDIESEIDEISDELGDEFIIYAEGGLGDRLRARLEEMIEKIKKAFDDGKGIDQNMFKKAQDFYEKIKNLGFELSEKFKQIFEDLRSKISQNSVEQAEFNFKDILRKIRDRISDKSIDVEKLKDQIETYFGKKSELANQLLDLLKSKGEKAKGKIIDFLNKLIGDDEAVYAAEGGIASRIRERIENIINRMKKNFDDGKGVRGDLFKKLDDLYQKYKNMGFELSEKFKSIFENLRSKVSRSRSVENADYNIFEIFRKLKQLIKDKVDADELKAKVESMFGKGSELAEQLVNILKEKGEKGKNKILALIDRILGEKETEKRSIKEVYERVKNYFKDLNIELKEKFTKFGEYVKEQYQKVREHGKTRAENLRKIAKEFLDDTKNLSKDVAEEALEFFREYKEDLGNVFDDVREKVRDILKKKEEKRSIKEVYERVKNYFRELNIDLKEKFTKFGEYVKEQYQKVKEQGKTRAENLRQIAREFLDDSKKMSKEVAEEALEFFREYKEDLGNVFDDVREKVRDILKKKEEKRSIKEVYERVKNYFKDLNIELKERFTKFGEYAKEQYQKVLEQGKTRAENIRKIAREFLDDSKKMSKEVAEEALGFFREYKEDLGNVFDDVRDKVRDILKKKE